MVLKYKGRHGIDNWADVKYWDALEIKTTALLAYLSATHTLQSFKQTFYMLELFCH